MIRLYYCKGAIYKSYIVLSSPHLYPLSLNSKGEIWVKTYAVELDKGELYCITLIKMI